jgi:cysteinyl-tRNA synthetase
MMDCLRERPAATRVCTAFVLAAGLMLSSAPAIADRALLKSANSWTYQLNGNIAPIASTGFDVAVVDVDHASNQGGITRLKTKPSGARRLVIGYLAIGEAETFRPYYKSCCTSGSKPSWLTTKTQGWAGNYVTRYWESGWKSIVMSRVDKMIAAGFDGVYLDRIDSWETMRAENANARGAMIQLVKDISAHARAKKGNFVIMVQNAEEMLTDNGYVAAIDALAKESLFYGVRGQGQRNSNSDITHSVGLLQRLRSRGKAIYVIEYLSGATTEKARAEIRAQGFIPYFGPRALDSQGR